MGRTPYASIVRENSSGSFDFAPKIFETRSSSWRSAQDDTGIGIEEQ